MDRELEVIRGEMEETRTNLTGKLAALETHVRETVSTATEAVSSTVEGVKDTVEAVSETVSETVENVTGTVESVTDSVAQSLDFGKRIQDHPWIAMGVAVGVGYVVAQLIGGTQSRSQQPWYPPPTPPPPPEPSRSTQEESDEEESSQTGVLGAAMSGLSGLAIGTLMGVVREVATNALPSEWKSELTQTIDQITANLGGKTLQAEPRKDNAAAPKPTEGRKPEAREERPREQKAQPEGTKRNGRNFFARSD